MGNFAIDISRWADKAKVSVGQLARSVAIQLGTAIIRRTPRDTGLARGNWQTGVNFSPTGTVKRLGEEASIPALEQETTKVQSEAVAGRNFFISMTNNLPYIVPLEDGHSQQAPHGMLKVTVTEYANVVNQALASVRSGR